MSQPLPHVTVSHLIVLIVRTLLLIVPFPACIPPPSVVTVTTPVPDSLLSLMDYCFSPIYCSTCLEYFPIVPIVSVSLLSTTSYCLCVPIVLYLLLFS